MWGIKNTLTRTRHCDHKQTHTHTHTKQQKWTVYMKYVIRMKWTNDLLRSVSIRFPTIFFLFCSFHFYNNRIDNFVSILFDSRHIWIHTIRNVWHIWFTIKLCHALWLSSFVEYFYIVSQSAVHFFIISFFILISFFQLATIHNKRLVEIILKLTTLKVKGMYTISSG